MTCQQRSIFARIAAATLCLLQASACATLQGSDSCDLMRLEEVGEPLLEEGNFTALYDLYLPCAQKGVPEAEYFITILIADIESNILQLDDAQREAEMRKWMCRSALHGFELAMETMADSYHWGWFGLPRDSEKEACWRGKLQDASMACDCPPD